MSEQPDRNPAQSNPYYGGNQPGDQQPVDPRNPKRGGINQLVVSLSNQIFITSIQYRS